MKDNETNSDASTAIMAIAIGPNPVFQARRLVEHLAAELAFGRIAPHATEHAVAVAASSLELAARHLVTAELCLKP